MSETPKATILVVDDEEIVVSLLKRSLIKAKYQVITARDGVQALEIFREKSAEIVGVVLDLSMPRMSGEETFDSMKDVDSNVRVILSTGFAEDAAIERFKNRGIAGFIQKPFRPTALIQKVREIFGPPPTE